MGGRGLNSGAWNKSRGYNAELAKQATFDYVTGQYVRINKGEDEQSRKLVDAYIEKGPHHSGTVRRGMVVTERELQPFLQSGAEISFGHPASFSRSVKIANDFARTQTKGAVGVVFEIKKSKTGMDVSGMSSAFAHEKEVLFSSNQKFRQVGSRPMANNKFLISLQEI